MITVRVEGEAVLFGRDVVDGVGCRGAGVELDGVHRRAVRRGRPEAALRRGARRRRRPLGFGRSWRGPPWDRIAPRVPRAERQRPISTNVEFQIEIVPADGIRLPFLKSGDFGTSRFWAARLSGTMSPANKRGRPAGASWRGGEGYKPGRYPTV
jgi:hypothetical protein